MPTNEIREIKDSVPEPDRRRWGRIDGRIGESIAVYLLLSPSEEPVEFRVIDFSSTGLALRSPAHGIPPNVLMPGSRVRADFRVGRRVSGGHRLNCVVSNRVELPDGRFRLGLAIIEDENRQAQEDLATKKTVALPSNFFLVGLIDHPLLYGQTSTFHVVRLSARHLVVRNNDTAFAVYPSMPVIFTLNLFAGNDPIHGTVAWVRHSAYGVDFCIDVDHISEATNRGIVRYIMRFLDWPPFRLKRVGLDTSQIKNIISYRFVRTQQEYIEVLQLRKAAYEAARKLKRQSSLADVSHEYDEHSRILTAWHHQTLVGSVAILFGDGVQVRFEAQKSIGDPQFAKRFGRGTAYIEVSGLCMHHEYRKGDILNGLFERIFSVLVTSDRKRIIASCDKHLWPLYESIGFAKTGVTYRAKGRAVDLDVIMIKRGALAYGWGQKDPLRWDEVFRGMAEHLDEAGLMKKSPRHMVVSPVYRAYIDLLKRVQESQAQFRDADPLAKVLDHQLIQKLLLPWKNLGDR